MTEFGLLLVAASVLTFVYAYVAYPAVLWLLGRWFGRKIETGNPEGVWPRISITVPAYNEEHQIADTVESLLAIDYPADRRQILIVSDGSTDRTDEIVQRYEGRGVELLRMTPRKGKTAAENAARQRLTGEIVVNTDASIRIHSDALKALVRPFSDPRVGLSSGRDLSVGASKGESNRGESNRGESNRGESGYVGYEMAVRDLETRFRGIVGASGCLYAIRRELHGTPLPDHLSRDFAAALVTYEKGFRAVSTPEALCDVPRTPSLKHEYRRKVRTITRGMETLHHMGRLLNPFRHGAFAWMLFSHKVCRWLLPWAAVGGMIGLALMAPSYRWAGLLLAASLVVAGAGVAGWALSERVAFPKLLQMTSYLVMGNVAALHATIRFLRGERLPLWEPTRR